MLPQLIKLEWPIQQGRKEDYIIVATDTLETGSNGYELQTVFSIKQTWI